MKRIFIILLFCVLLTSACSPAVTDTPPSILTNVPTASIPTDVPTTIPTDSPATMRSETLIPFALSSPAFTDGETIPNVYSCRGDGISPALAWGDPPVGTQTFALVMDDPDANGFIHWIIYNIPPDRRSLAENIEQGQELDDGMYQGLNSVAAFGYFGPCPPSGTHHYIFKFYALDTVLTKEDGSSKASLLGAIQGHILVESELIGTYP